MSKRRAVNVSVTPKQGEFIEKTIRKFMRKTKKEGFLQSLKKYEYYEKPSVQENRRRRKRKKTLDKLRLKQQKSESQNR
jgi:ribosomal protein S21